jgi:hypothetical protein
MTYEAAKKRAMPYDKLIEALPEMRLDTLRIVRQSSQEGRSAYVLVNNRAEGNAPITIQALVDALDQPTEPVAHEQAGPLPPPQPA